MAKKSQPSGPENSKPPKGDGESIQGYFRNIFHEKPKLLKERSNEELLAHWRADHPNEKEVPQRVKTGLANLKSVLRSKGRKKKAAKAARVGSASPLASKPRLLPLKSKLETLEEQIDECLTYSRSLDREGLEDVITHLRKARNAVVWKMGQ